MRICKNCGVELAPNAHHCALCGAESAQTKEPSSYIFGIYNEQIVKPKQNTVRDIFIGILLLLVGISGVVSAVLRTAAPVIYTAIGAAFIWLAILAHIFRRHNTKTILNQTWLYVGLLVSLMLVHFGHTQIAVAYVVPIILIIGICTECMIVFIGVKFRVYAISLQIMSILAIAFFIVNIALNWTYYASLAAAVLGIMTILSSFVFGRKTLGVEFKKKFHC